MAAELFTLPFRPALNPRGIPIAGAKLCFFVSGGLTPAVVYADAALTTPLSNPVIADSAGKWPSIYLDEAVTYRIRLKDASGNLLPGHDIDPYYTSLADAALEDIAELQSDLLSLTSQVPPNSATTAFWFDFIDEAYSVDGALQDDLDAALTALSGTFTRANAGTLTNSSGLTVAGVVDTPRTTYDEATLTELGILYEDAASNLWPYSMIPASVAGGWYYSQTNTTVAGMTLTGIDGTTSAGTVKETVTNATHTATYYDSSASVTSGETYPVQFWFKGLSRTKFRFLFIALMGVPGTATGGFIPVDVDLTAGTVSDGWEIVERDDGFWRISCVATATGTGVPYFTVQIKNDSGALSYTGDTTKGIVIGAVQLEAGTRATSYIHRASGTAASRAADALTVTIPAGVSKLTVVYDDLSIDVLDVTPGSYTLDPADMSRGTIAKLIAADMTDYSYVTSVAGKGPGKVTLEQSDIAGLRKTDNPTFNTVTSSYSTLYSPNLAFLSFSNVTEGAITGTPRGSRIGWNAGALAVTFNNSTVYGPGSCTNATNISTSDMIGDTIASAATLVSGSDGVGNELFNNLTSVTSSVGMGNLGLSATGLAALQSAVFGAEVARWHGGNRLVAVGYKALYGSSGSTGTLTDCTAIGANAGLSVTGSRTGLGLYGAGVEPPTATTDNYVNLENVFQGSTTGGAFTLTTKTGGAASLTVSGVTLSALATSDPAVTGRLWDAGGVAAVSGSALGPWDFWAETWFGGTNQSTIAGSMFAGAAISSGNVAIDSHTQQKKGYNPVGNFVKASATVNSGYKAVTNSLSTQYFGQIGMKFQALLTPATDFANSTIRAGWLNTITSAPPTNGAWFEMDGSGVWSAKTGDGGSITTAGTTYASTIDVPLVLDIEANAAGTSIRFRIYAGNNPTAVFDQSITTNIPTTTGNATGSGAVLTNSSGSPVEIAVLHALKQGTLNGYNRARG